MQEHELELQAMGWDFAMNGGNVGTLAN